MLEWFEDPQHITLVLEFIDGGDLLNYIMEYDGGQNPLREQRATGQADMQLRKKPSTLRSRSAGLWPSA